MRRQWREGRPRALCAPPRGEGVARAGGVAAPPTVADWTGERGRGRGRAKLLRLRIWKVRGWGWCQSMRMRSGPLAPTQRLRPSVVASPALCPDGYAEVDAPPAGGAEWSPTGRRAPPIRRPRSTERLSGCAGSASLHLRRRGKGTGGDLSFEGEEQRFEVDRRRRRRRRRMRWAAMAEKVSVLR